MFENRVLRRNVGPKRHAVTGIRDSYTVRSFVILTFYQILLGGGRWDHHLNFVFDDVETCKWLVNPSHHIWSLEPFYSKFAVPMKIISRPI